MNTTRIITIVCWVVSALVLTGLVIWFITGSIFGGWISGLGGFNMFGININRGENLTGPFTSQNTQTVAPSDIHSLNINWVAGEVTIIPHDGSEITVTEYAQRELRDNERFRVSTSAGTMTVRFRENNLRGNMPRKNLEILVPRALSEDLTQLIVNTTSGSVKFEDFNAATVRISTVSASVNITKITSQSININTTSGAVTASSVNADKLDASTVSGAITVTDSLIKTLDSSTTSGRTNASGEFDRVDISTVSGSTNIKSTTAPDRISVSSVSGSTEVHIPEPLNEITVSHSAVSGRFSSEIPVRMQNGGAYNFSSVSGSTNIYLLG